MNKTQEQINETYPKVLSDIDSEIVRAKMLLIENGYQVDDAFYNVVRKYREELRSLRSVVAINIE